MSVSPLLTINHITRKALEILSMPEDEFNRRNEMELEAEIARLEAENRRLRARIVELEAAAAITLGTLDPPPADDEPARYTLHVPPSAPPHDE